MRHRSSFFKPPVSEFERAGEPKSGLETADVRPVKNPHNETTAMLRGLERSSAPPGVPIEVTISVGVAEWTAQMRQPEDLIAMADAALYRAKHAGRNRVSQ